MPERATVIIDGKPYCLVELKPRANAEWRRAFDAQFGALLHELPGLVDLSLDSAADLIAVLERLWPVLLEKADQVWALCCQYDPAFENGYESEAVDAFKDVLGLAFPFGSLIDLAARGGLAPVTTGTNSAAPSGVSAAST